MRLPSSFAAALFLGLALFAALLPSDAKAGPYEDALAKFTTDSYADTFAGLGLLVTSGNERAGSVVAALGDGRLLFDPASKLVYIKAHGRYADRRRHRRSRHRRCREPEDGARQ